MDTRKKTEDKKNPFYFGYDLDKAHKEAKERNPAKGAFKKRNPIDRNLEDKKSGGVEYSVQVFPPQKMKKEFWDINLKKQVVRSVPQCCAKKTRSDPPIRCKKAALKGYDYCRSHGGAVLKYNKDLKFRKYSDEELRGQLDKLRRSDLLDIKDEIGLTIIVLKKYVESYIKNANKLDNQDVTMFIKLIESITKNTKMLHDMKYGEEIITKEKLQKVLIERAKREIHIIEAVVQDNELKKNLLNEFSRLGKEEI